MSTQKENKKSSKVNEIDNSTSKIEQNGKYVGGRNLFVIYYIR